DSFTYKAKDFLFDSNVATVTITVNAVNDTPTANNDSYSLDEDTTLTVNAPGVLANDTDVDNAPRTTLLSEGFDELPLKAFQSNSTTGDGDGTDWTDALPPGFTRDNTTTPQGPPAEFDGFNVLDIDSWIATQGDQARSLFTKGGVGAHGSIIV